ncbi:GntR family transcriptional regulator [Yinghuangia soli]|uniref:UTRA domain-containing protein n=1 Tax=Yinghuangia soli TaxID=2908204 RepID=A0AA41PYR4_9ACTN|nr:UTRA domain-containing protein [Yinghuangia soli]MCF2528394.1 UTRA domain-containing protein [Yinghuangia soli]
MDASDWVSSSMPYVAPQRGSGSDAWAAEAAAAGRRGTQRILHAGEVAAPAEVAELLGQSGTDKVVVRRRLMLLDDEPCEVTDTYYPAAIAGGTQLAATAKIRGGAISLLAELGHVGTHIREDVTARLPSAEERAALALDRHSPVLCLTRTTLDRDGRAIQVDLMVMPAHRQRLRYEMGLG